MRLSVLDQTPIRAGSNAVEALRESVELVVLAEELGYHRYWLSEHHNITTLAGAAPEVLIARLAAATSRIRMGSGGIMLPNHSALKVAENFRLLEAMFPGRIDLGLGRAPGGDRLTAQMLNPSNSFNPQDYIQQLNDLYDFLYDQEQSSVKMKVRAIPIINTAPALWMLTSSGESAYLAAHFGMALAFATFISPNGAQQAIANYKERFRPGLGLEQPETAVAIFAFCSEDGETVRRAQLMMDFRLLHIGDDTAMPSYETASRFEYSPAQQKQIEFNRGRMIIGEPSQVKMRLQKLADECETGELIISTFADRAEDRLESYRLIKKMFV
jgi:luciferase family oxidoreductase group 1